jgi:DNA-binding transcriptional ArsR family regulator
MDIFAALAVPTRRNIVEMLARDGQLSSTDISNGFDLTPSAISQHLKVLHEAKLVNVERHAQKRIYELNPKAFAELAKWATLMNQRFDRLERVLENEEK